MKYYNLKDKTHRVSFKEAAVNGQPPGGGLYFPESIPVFSRDLLNSLSSMPREELAYRIISPYIENEIDDASLIRIVAETIDFDIPLVQVSENISTLELFHGPTLAFKDIGARFMSRCLGYFMRNDHRKVTVLVATSGDTGGAVANGFYDVEGVDVCILYPSGKVSRVQEKQLTTLGKNITAFEVSGSFDDCQAIVKSAFNDAELKKQFFLTSANSINVARWLPQQFYYAFALQQWAFEEPPVIAVPSGNFGNICAGLLAMRSGLPVKHFIAACNVNDTVSDYLATGEMVPKIARPTLSNAMDVGDPSNFARILELFDHSLEKLRIALSAETITDDETSETIKAVHANFNYTLDPHGAVGYLALERYLKNEGGKGIFLETAHTVKFPEAVENATGVNPTIPETLKPLLQKEKKAIMLPASFEEFKEIMLQKN